MPTFRDKRGGKDLELAAIKDAKRDSVGAYGRKHPASDATPIERDHNGRPMQVREHHSGDVFNSRCKACKADAKAGKHPRA